MLDERPFVGASVGGGDGGCDDDAVVTVGRLVGMREPVPTSEPVVGVGVPALAVGVAMKTQSLEMLDFSLADGVATKSLSSLTVNALPSGVRKPGVEVWL